MSGQLIAIGTQMLTALPQALFVGVVAWLAFRYPKVFLGSYLTFVVLSGSQATSLTLPVIAVGSLTIYPDDLVTALCAMAALVSSRNLRLQGITRKVLHGWIAFTLCGAAFWIANWGLEAGVNGWRATALSLALPSYTLTRTPPLTIGPLLSVVVFPSLLAALLTLVSVARTGVHAYTETVLVDGTVLSARANGVAVSVLMLVSVFVVMSAPDLNGLVKWLIVTALGTAVLLSQHRSVWTAAIAGLAVWAVLGIRRGTFGHFLGRVLALGAGVFLMLLIFGAQSGLQQSAGDQRTWLWRQSHWEEELSVPRSALEWLVGGLFGPTAANESMRFAAGSHSFYVAAIQLVGLVGLVMQLWLVLASMRGRVGELNRSGIVIGTTLMVFGVSYSWPAWAWIFVGASFVFSESEAPTLDRRKPYEGHVAPAPTDMSDALASTTSEVGLH